MTISEIYIGHYRPIRLVGHSPKTLDAYRSAVAHWSNFSQVSIERIDARLIAEWQGVILTDHAAASVNTYLRGLMAILRYAAEEGLIPKLPKVRKLKELKRVPLALTIGEFSTVLAASAHEKQSELWKAALLTAWETGLRLRALLSIRPIDVLWDSKGLYCQADEQKTSQAQWFQLQPDTLESIRAIWSMENNRLFNFRRTQQTLSRNLRRIYDSCGIYAPHGSGSVWHRLRKSKASYTQLAGGSAMEALGHSRASVTARYLDPRIVGTAHQPPMPMPQHLLK